MVLPGQDRDREEAPGFPGPEPGPAFPVLVGGGGGCAYHKEGRCVMESRAMPASLAAWKISPSTSMLTALVHSSRRAYLGLGAQREWAAGRPLPPQTPPSARATHLW